MRATHYAHTSHKKKKEIRREKEIIKIDYE